MYADERRLEPRRHPVEWKPSPDMYRMDTREGMEAYEASFRMKIAPWLEQAGTPPRAAVHPSKPTPGLPGTPAVPQEDGLPIEDRQTHANLG